MYQTSARPKLKVIAFPGGPGLSCHTMDDLLKLLPEGDEIIECNCPRPISPSSAGLRNFDDLVDMFVHQHSASLNGHQALFIGHSAGAFLASACALRFPRQAIGLITVCSPLIQQLHAELNRFQSSRIEEDPEFRNAWKKYFTRPTTKSYRSLAKAYIPWLSQDVPTQQKIHSQFHVDRVSPQATRRWQLPQKEYARLEQDLSRNFTLPKLAILGNEDQLVPHDFAREEYLQMGFSVSTVPGGHFCFMDSAIHTQAALTEWIEDNCETEHGENRSRSVVL